MGNPENIKKGGERRGGAMGELLFFFFPCSLLLFFSVKRGKREKQNTTRQKGKIERYDRKLFPQTNEPWGKEKKEKGKKWTTVSTKFSN